MASTSNTNVEPYAFGNHIHYVGMPVCDICESENETWDSLLAKYTTYELATKLTKTPAFRAYRQARPFDDYEPPLSLDAMMEAGIVIPDDGPSVEEMFTTQEELTTFKVRLTGKQLQVMELLVDGYSSREITDQNGYKSTGGVRYFRHAIRKKYKKFQS